MKLYGTPLSPRYVRVAIAAAELDLPVQLVELNPVKGNQASEQKPQGVLEQLA